MVSNVVISSVVFIFLCAGFVSADPDVKEGKWEITTKVEMSGMPGGIPPQTMTQCITKKNMVTEPEQKNPNCKMVNSNVSGDTVSWAMTCKEKDRDMESKDLITYKGEKFSGVINSMMTQKGQQSVKMTAQMTGRRIGECK